MKKILIGLLALASISMVYAQENLLLPESHSFTCVGEHHVFPFQMKVSKKTDGRVFIENAVFGNHDPEDFEIIEESKVTDDGITINIYHAKEEKRFFSLVIRSDKDMLGYNIGAFELWNEREVFLSCHLENE